MYHGKTCNDTGTQGNGHKGSAVKQSTRRVEAQGDRAYRPNQRQRTEVLRQVRRQTGNRMLLYGVSRMGRCARRLHFSTVCAVSVSQTNIEHSERRQTGGSVLNAAIQSLNVSLMVARSNSLLGKEPEPRYFEKLSIIIKELEAGIKAVEESLKPKMMTNEERR